ncbi:hypothetical protein [Azospirillum canadense]|uniref:hypothetical protein n=1 Tax=Azospirillum canadense TaxID=403962 RepID=UPI002227C84E|nr:hypothetical protein [Azospirillum canadense]MCW2240708.1 hypothetical protein [Azospirillum canadense]
MLRHGHLAVLHAALVLSAGLVATLATSAHATETAAAATEIASHPPRSAGRLAGAWDHLARHRAAGDHDRAAANVWLEAQPIARITPLEPAPCGSTATVAAAGVADGAARHARDARPHPITTTIHVITVQAADVAAVFTALNNGQTATPETTLGALRTVAPAGIVTRLDPFGSTLVQTTATLTGTSGETASGDDQAPGHDLLATGTPALTNDGRLGVADDVRFTTDDTDAARDRTGRAITRYATSLSVAPNDTVVALAFNTGPATILLLPPTL